MGVISGLWEPLFVRVVVTVDFDVNKYVFMAKGVTTLQRVYRSFCRVGDAAAKSQFSEAHQAELFWAAAVTFALHNRPPRTICLSPK